MRIKHRAASGRSECIFGTRKSKKRVLLGCKQITLPIYNYYKRDENDFICIEYQFETFTLSQYGRKNCETFSSTIGETLQY